MVLEDTVIAKEENENKICRNIYDLKRIPLGRRVLYDICRIEIMPWVVAGAALGACAYMFYQGNVK
ncbi:MAG: hypothetical protein AABW65_00640 [Nanoarchaeota archaeon]